MGVYRHKFIKMPTKFKRVKSRDMDYQIKIKIIHQIDPKMVETLPLLTMKRSSTFNSSGSNIKEVKIVQEIEECRYQETKNK